MNAARAAEHAWPRNVLTHQIAAHQPPAESDLARQLVYDPFMFDSLDVTDTAHGAVDEH